MRRFKRFLSEESGPTTVEYAILLTLLVLGSVTTLGGFGGGVKNIYTSISGALPTGP